MGFHKSDRDGVTDISFEALKKIKEDGHKLRAVTITRAEFGHICDFSFEGDSHYIASGFSIGYGGTGPHGLHKAIRMWDETLDFDFWNTAISKLDPKRTWIYSPGKGFGTVETFEEHV